MHKIIKILIIFVTFVVIALFVLYKVMEGFFCTPPYLQAVYETSLPSLQLIEERMERAGWKNDKYAGLSVAGTYFLWPGKKDLVLRTYKKTHYLGIYKYHTNVTFVVPEDICGTYVRSTSAKDYFKNLEKCLPNQVTFKDAYIVIFIEKRGFIDFEPKEIIKVMHYFREREISKMFSLEIKDGPYINEYCD